jgi:NAD(P)H-hydrate epimerase
MDYSSALYTASQARELDLLAVEQGGLSGTELMARAGAAAFRVLRARFPRACHVVVACGPGNNGGDGYVLARLARQAGMDVALVALGDSGHASLDATAARVQAEAAGLVTHPFTERRLQQADVIVDALLGIGLQRPVQGEWCSVIDAINRCGRPVLALDVPSGLHADTGAILGAAVRARVTVTFIGV